MSDKITLIPQPIVPPSAKTAGNPGRQNKPSGASFDEVFSKELRGSDVGFSRHAKQRLASRSIELSAADLTRLNQAVDQVRSKGGRDSLVMLNDNALIVSVKNNQVVTVVDQDSLKNNVFTNIDSAIIA
ncbi:MAG: TIGR02530 family flagellar biosynthesis protein [Syntrophotaleaceae bacterium]